MTYPEWVRIGLDIIVKTMCAITSIVLVTYNLQKNLLIILEIDVPFTTTIKFIKLLKQLIVDIYVLIFSTKCMQIIINKQYLYNINSVENLCSFDNE